MARATYGDDVKARVKCLFKALISLNELIEDNCGIKFKWHKSVSDKRKLVVKTTLRHLEALIKKDGKNHLTKAQIREALKRMEDFLGILTDDRLKKKGSEDWDFTLTPWYTDLEKNLKQFDIEWENHRPTKSKRQAAATAAAARKAKSAKYKKSSFCQAPPLPQYFVERPIHQEKVKNLLLEQSANRPGTLVVSAVYGLGGIGKSILAAALAHNLEVQSHFPDGILWVTLGQNPDLLPFLGNWIQRLGDHNYKPITVKDASMYLQTLLYDKKALLVVDDVWNPEHVEPFRVGGSNCRVLVTTREAVIKGANRYDLDVLTPDESLKLLHKSCGLLKQDERQLAEELADTVGYLPLALDLAAAQVAEGVTLAELNEDLRTDIAYLETLDLPDLEKYSSEEKCKHYSLIASFNLSLRSLIPEMLRQFAWLGVLPEDVNITSSMAATLWEITPRQALTTLRSFKTKALLLSGKALDKQKPTYRLHDLMHDMAKRLLTGEASPHKPHELPGLRLELPDAHSLLLERYQKKTKSGLWHTLEDDGYIYGNLSWHLEQAGKTEELHQLLQEETETGHNGWYEACDRLGQTANFVTDVARAWQLAEDCATETTLAHVGLQCRYAFITASLNSLAANVPVKLLIALLKKGAWTSEQGLAYVLQSSNPKQKAHLLTELANHLSTNLKKLALSKALSAAGQIQDDYYRAKALSSLADKLPSELLPEAVAAARHIQDDSSRADALSSLAHKLPELLPEAVAAARHIQDDYYRAKALSSLAHKLSQIRKTQLFDSWKETLHILSLHTRPNLLTDIKALTPVIFSLGSEQALKDTADAIQDVSRWWP